MSEAWGPWIEHDGKTAPVGMYVQARSHAGHSGEGIVDQTAIDPGNGFVSRWIYEEITDKMWVTYRIRKPKGLTILTDILREVENTKQPEYTA